MRWGWVGVGAVLAAVAGIPGDLVRAQEAPAQEPPANEAAQEAQPVFRTGINFVRVDVIVSDSRTGELVTDLTQADFEVTENDAPQTIETFKLVELDGRSGPAPDVPPRPIRNDSDEEVEAARDEVRLFGIFLDDYHVRRGASVQFLEPLSRFIETELGPSDMIGVLYPLQAVSSMRMTRDRASVIRALRGFVGVKGDYNPRNAMEAQYANYPAEDVERIRNQVSLSALKGLITRLGSLKEGRKALILVSEGYSNSLPPQLRDPVASAPGLGNPLRDDAQAGVGNLTEQRHVFFSDAALQLSMREVYDVANRNNVAIYPVDPRGLPVGEFDLTQASISDEVNRDYLNATMDTLRSLAEETDGRAIVNRNDLGPAMTQIVRDSSGYYLLGYNSTEAPADGKFHEIKVQVNRPGVRVRARRGYWALTTTDVAKILEPKPEPPKAIETALAAISAPAAAQRAVRTWVGTSRGAGGKTTVTLVWEPSAAVRDPRRPAPAQVMLTAIDEDGSLSYRGRASEPRISFDADPGTVTLRISVEAESSEVLDTETREVTVPDLTGPGAAVGTPQLLRARTARDVQQIKNDPAAVPTAAREFSRTERLVIRVPAYGPGGAVSVSARLLNRAGQPMSDLPVAPSGIPDIQQLEMGLAGLAAGEYLLEIKAGDSTELVGFRVTS
jgi:VWFA-related protein